jgi:hypothetical protein
MVTRQDWRIPKIVFWGKKFVWLKVYTCQNVNLVNKMSVIFLTVIRLGEYALTLSNLIDMQPIFYW